MDDALYPVTSGISLNVMKNIEYGREARNRQKVSLELCILLYKQYGTTMADLQAIGYQFDYDDFGSFVHGRLAYEMLKPAAPPSFLTSSCSAHHYTPTSHVTVPSLLIWMVLCNPLLQEPVASQDIVL